MISWLKSNFLTLLIAAVGLISSYYFYSISVKERIPVVLETLTQRTSIIKVDSLDSSKLNIVDNDGNVFKKDINILKIYFFNMGKESIRPENILRDLYVKFLGGEVEILKINIVSGNRLDIIAPVAKLYGSDEIRFNFDILEYNDGFRVEVLFAGDINSKLEIYGTIEGYGNIVTTESWSENNNYKSIIYFILLLIVMYFLMSSRSWVKLYFAKKSENKQKIKESRIEILGWVALVIIIVILFYFESGNVYFNGYGTHDLIKSIPKDLM